MYIGCTSPSSDGQDVGEDMAVFDYARGGLGALSPTGSVYMVDKFDLSTLLKSPD